MADRIVIGISGASGAPIAAALLKALKKERVQTHLVISRGGAMTIEQAAEKHLPALQRVAKQIEDGVESQEILVAGR